MDNAELRKQILKLDEKVDKKRLRIESSEKYKLLENTKKELLIKNWGIEGKLKIIENNIYKKYLILPRTRLYKGIERKNIKSFKEEINFGILRQEDKLNSLFSRYNTISKKSYNKIIKMRMLGLTYKKIGGKVNIPEGTIWSWVNKTRKPKLK